MAEHVTKVHRMHAWAYHSSSLLLTVIPADFFWLTFPPILSLSNPDQNALIDIVFHRCDTDPVTGLV